MKAMGSSETSALTTAIGARFQKTCIIDIAVETPPQDVFLNPI
jgi:hypothetical protein